MAEAFCSNKMTDHLVTIKIQRIQSLKEYVESLKR